MKRFVSLLVVAFVILAMGFTVFGTAGEEELMAKELKELRLFKGVTDTEFELDRAPTRVEAVVMLIRVLGKENEALDGVWRHPFEDVPQWADKYIGYAYSNGLSNGLSLTEFGTGKANAAMYVTFVLRSLGYSDEHGKDFVWNDPFTLAKSEGLVNDTINLDNFLRADVVNVSHRALTCYIKNSKTRLADKLIEAGVFTQKQFDTVYNSYKSGNVAAAPLDREVTAADIYKENVSSVVYVSGNHTNGITGALGSGFFIDNRGTLVTNWHVIEDFAQAQIKFKDSNKAYDILGVYDYDKGHDWAVVKVDISDTVPVKIGNDSSVIPGSRVFALGNPMEMEYSVSEGIVSGEKRNVNGHYYIQYSAPTSSGNSGGALFNLAGEVVGIPTFVHANAQNLNLAVPLSSVLDYKREKVTTFEELFGKYDPNLSKTAESDLPKKKRSLEELSRFIIQSGSYENPEYTKTQSDEEGSLKLCLGLDVETGVVLVTIEKDKLFEELISYSFTISPDTTITDVKYSVYELAKGNKYELASSAKVSFDCTEFDGRSLDWDEYRGENEGQDARQAAALHILALQMIDTIFEEELSDRGFYRTKYLGYNIEE